PWTNVGAGHRRSDVGIHPSQVRHPAGHHHYRIGHRHSDGEYADRGRSRGVRAFAALPAPRARGPRTDESLLLPVLFAVRAAHAGRARPLGSIARIYGTGVRLSLGDARHGNSRRGEFIGAAATRPYRRRRARFVFATLTGRNFALEGGTAAAGFALPQHG